MRPSCCRVPGLGAMLGATLFLSATAQQAPRPQTLVKAGRLIDGRSDAPQANVGILVEGDRIVAVGPLAQVQGQAKNATVVDLAAMTVLPGFIDAHTHLLLQGDPTSESYDQQLLYQSTPYRAILAARNARIALEHGFTAIRDLETEGAMYADVDVKLAVSRGEIPGPRIFAATRAMAPTGMYPIVGTNWELELPHGVQPVDGVEGARLAVRQQVAHGADWIKYYSDRRYYFGADSVLHSWVNFTDEEAKAIVDEAHRHGRRRLSLDRAQPGEGVRVLRSVRHDAAAGDQDGHRGRRGAARAGGPDRCRRPRALRGPRRGAGRPAQGHHGTRARAVRYERRGRVSFEIVRRALWCSLSLCIGAVGTGLGQLAPPGTGGVAALTG